MTNAAILEAYETLTFEQPVVEQSPAVAKRVLPKHPAAPFPHKYVHAVFANARDARQAALSLLVAGIDEKDIHLMGGKAFTEAAVQGQSAAHFLSSMDFDVYLREASRDRYFVAVRPTGYNQLTQIRDLLAPHRARHVKYIDTWTVAELLP